MNISIYKTKEIISVFAILAIIVSIFSYSDKVNAENLKSTNFEIQDATINNGGSTLDSTNFSLVGNLGSIADDTRFTSGTYDIKTQFGMNLLNVPKVQCFETNSTSDNTSCLNLPSNKGMLGECGSFGCYSKAKIEIDSQGNPFDTLYTVRVLNVTDNITYYLKSDHTLSLTQTISNYLSKCAIEGIDNNDPNCDQIGDSGWNSNLQSANIYYLEPNKTYQASIKALNGDYSETGYSDIKSTITTSQSMSLDLDIGPSNNPTIESAAPYSVNVLSGGFYQTVQTASDLVWFNFNSNNPKGFDFYIQSKNAGLYSATKNILIPSESEDLAIDSNNDGGYGIKIYNDNTTQDSLGPLIKSSLYNTSGTDEVGAVSNIYNLLFSTNSINTNKGEILNGRGAIILKARTKVTTPAAGDYSDELSFTMIGDF